MGDGDRMGKCVAGAKKAEDHASISRQLAAFADEAIETVRNHRGHMLYAGGEDILALLPLSAIIDAPRMLAGVFKGKIDELFIEDVDQSPTLRVGVAVCHVLEPLGRIRQYADEAEKYAKGEAGTNNQGNALGLRLHVRVGHDIPVRISFDDVEGFESLAAWKDAYGKGKFPGRLAYDTRAIGERCKKMRYSDDVAAAEFKRLHQRARDSVPEALRDKELWQRLEERAKKLSETRKGQSDGFSQALIDLGNELVLSRWAAAKKAAEVGERS